MDRRAPSLRSLIGARSTGHASLCGLAVLAGAVGFVCGFVNEDRRIGIGDFLTPTVVDVGDRLGHAEKTCHCSSGSGLSGLKYSL